MNTHDQLLQLIQAYQPEQSTDFTHRIYMTELHPVEISARKELNTIIRKDKRDQKKQSRAQSHR